MWLRLAANAGALAMTIAALAAAALTVASGDLPKTDRIWSAQRAPRVVLLARDGSPLSVYGETVGAPVRLAELPSYVPLAVLAVEDRNFRHHVGVNPAAIVRALIADARAGEIVQGGSTITQQLAKNLFLSSDRTLQRKFKEALLALRLERRFTKDEILTLYLNRVYFGAGAYGIDAAARRYFDKPARALSVGEAAVLAGLLKAPSRYAPTRNPDDAGFRARLVIDAMEKARFLGAEEAAAARAESVVIRAPRYAAAPYFHDYALGEAQDLAGGLDADLVVQTTFDPALQTALEEGLRAGLAMSPLPDEVEVAAVILDAEGAVRAMIGGRDYRKSQFNRASRAFRQPGSAFKPFVYLAAIETGSSPNDPVLDAPVAVDRWRPDNYGGRYYGEVSLSEALARSLNSAAVRLQETTGRAAVRAAARRMGLDRPLARGPALALGVDLVSPLELARAYVPFANGGFRVNAHAVDAIRSADGELVRARGPALVDVAASYRSVALLNSMLAEAVRAGTGRAAAIPGRRVYGKTGTSQGGRDAWFAGHAGGLVCVVWVGRDDDRPMGVAGGGAPAVVWREAMARALAARERAGAVPPLLAPAIADEPRLRG